MKFNNLKSQVTGFASTAPGLEPVVQTELMHWEINGTIENGGVEFESSFADFIEISMNLRCPSRILLRLAKSQMKQLSDLHALLNQPMLTQLLPQGCTVNLKVSCRQTLLRSDIVKSKAQRMLRAILKGSTKGVEQHIFIRISGNQADLSIDPIGFLRHKRGWRLEQGKAPLRENWAATLLTMAGWGPDEPLIDPFCGAGTIPIEAALMAQNKTPFVNHAFAFSEWNFQHSPSLAVTSKDQTPVFIEGSDHHTPSLEWAKRNAARAGINCTFKRRDIANLNCLLPRGLIVSNPPYGKRLGQDVQQCYRWLGKRMRQELPTWRAIFLAPNQKMAHMVDRNVQCLSQFKNGGQSVGVWILEPFEPESGG